MKYFKLILVNAMILFIGICLMTGVLTGGKSEHGKTEKVPELEIQGLRKYQGQYLTVYYAIGSRPLFSTDNSKIHLNQVKESRSVYISSEKIRFATMEVEKEGFRPSYNIVVFVVSKRPNYTWLNSDGETPQGIVATKNNTATFINAVNKTTIDDNVKMDPKNLIAINLRNF